MTPEDPQPIISKCREVSRPPRPPEITGARYAVIIAIDDTGQLEDYVMSGLPRDESRQLAECPQHMEVFEICR